MHEFNLSPLPLFQANAEYERKTEQPGNFIRTENRITANGLEEKFSAMCAGLEQKMARQKEQIEELLIDLKRPIDPEYKQTEQKHAHKTKHKEAFQRYMRSGDENAFRDLETKALLSSATGAEGGFLVSPQTATSIYQTLKTQSEMRSLAGVVITRAPSIEFLIDPDDYGVNWISETGARAETSNSLLRKVIINVHELYAMPKATQRLLDDSAFDVESWIADRVGERFSRTESAAFVNGDGVNKPFGFLSKTSVAQTIWSWGNLGYIASGAAADFPGTDPYEKLIDLLYALKPGYRKNAVWLMNSKTAARIRKFKDGDGNYLWKEANANDQDAKLLGYTVFISEDMPDVAANSLPIAFGDFKRGYMIADGTEIRILRDPYSAKPHIFFYVTKRVGGDVVDFDAIKLLKIAVS